MSETYGSDGGGGRPSAAVKAYDPVKREWSAKANDDSGGKTTGSTKSTTGASSLGKGDSKKKADKDFIEIEYRTLIGDLKVTPSKESIKIKVGDTITIEGVGTFLSGLYFVAEVKRTLDSSSGYSHSLTVIKTGFGDSLKTSKIAVPPKTRLPEVQKLKKK